MCGPIIENEHLWVCTKFICLHIPITLNPTKNSYKQSAVVPGDAGGAMAPPDFGRSVNPISTKGVRLCPPNNNGTPGFSDLPTALTVQEIHEL
jgi:hypothetical protein